jgi:hypothetical protein
MAKRKSYEGSKADLAEDKRGAKRKGVTLKVYEKTPEDRTEDRRGQARLKQRSK